MNLRRFNLTFAEILKPRRQLPQHEDPRHQVEATAHGRFIDGEGAGESFGGLCELSAGRVRRPARRS